jgi:hypothetical protein
VKAFRGFESLSTRHAAYFLAARPSGGEWGEFEKEWNGMEFLAEAWARLIASDAIIAAVITALVPLMAFALSNWISPKTKLKYGVQTSLVMLPKRADGTDGVLYVQQVAVQNWGRKAAEDVEVIWNWKPPHIEQYPHLASHDEIKQDGRYIAKIPLLNGREGMNFSILSEGQPLPTVIYVRGRGTKAKLIEFRTNYWLPLWGRVVFVGLLLLGFFAAVYLLVLLVGFVFFGRVPSL